ncbi:MAG: hypothetical protein M3550_16425 [Actinomycetota bacterium]|nr:hypothetical protein [Actinomycetota bacterium]
MRRLAALIVIGTLTALALPASSAGSAIVRNCNHAVDFNLKIISARNMRCRAARSVMRRNDDPIAVNFAAPNGFRCRLKEGGPLGGTWRCTRGEKAFRFDFAD